MHWDNFFRPLGKELRPLPRVMDKFARTREMLDRKSAASGLPVRFQQPYDVITPFG
ncbi:hypothetical protein [Lentzea aerocolonigenes]|uniref:hypothetical protein n=1 Tax=Lentzea aerocolonigenes TaxID=68170 RepID=UPI001E4857D1|nr:hypothetical protein [Lentzea aerocolonigenes]